MADKSRSIGPAAVLALAFAVIVLAVVGVPSQRKAEAPAPAAAPADGAPAATVRADGFALTSTAITLPDDAPPFPPGPDVAAITANCTACHSPSMVLTQPHLTADQWQAEVKKMREVYHAPVPDAAVPAILRYLTALGTTPTGDAPPPAAGAS